MGRTLEERVRTLEAAIRGLSGGGTTTVITTGGSQTPTPIGVLSNGQLVGTERNLNFANGFTVTDDPGNKWVLVQPLTSSGTAGPGLLDLGAGQATGVGYTSLTATTFTALDLNQDLPIRAAAGDCVKIELQAFGTVGAGALFLDVLSVNSGLYASEGTASGPGWMHWPASYTGPITQTFWMFLTAADIVNNTAIFRIVYRVASGTSTLLANDVDGRLKLLAWNLGTAVPVLGQNTGAPPVTPPNAGTFTARGPEATTSTAATTAINSATYTPTAAHEIWAAVWIGVSGLSPATLTMTITDTFGDTGGTAWTQRAKTIVSDSGTGSNSVWLFSRTIGTGPASGHHVATRNAGSHAQSFTTYAFETAAVTETPSQVIPSSPTNVSTIPFSTSPIGSTSFLIALAYNPTSSFPASNGPVVPTSGGTWTQDVQGLDGGSDGYALGHILGPSGTSFTWTGLLADNAQDVAAAIVLDPSGATTAPPGYETFTIADKSGGTADQTWVDMTT